MPEASESWPTGQEAVVGAYNGLRPCAQILPRKINRAAGRERRDDHEMTLCKAQGHFMIEPKRPRGV